MDDLILKEMTELTQLLLGQVWALPLERSEDVIVAAVGCVQPSSVFFPRAKEEDENVCTFFAAA